MSGGVVCPLLLLPAIKVSSNLCRPPCPHRGTLVGRPPPLCIACMWHMSARLCYANKSNEASLTYFSPLSVCAPNYVVPRDLEQILCPFVFIKKQMHNLEQTVGHSMAECSAANIPMIQPHLCGTDEGEGAVVDPQLVWLLQAAVVPVSDYRHGDIFSL